MGDCRSSSFGAGWEAYLKNLRSLNVPKVDYDEWPTLPPAFAEGLEPFGRTLSHPSLISEAQEGP